MFQGDSDDVPSSSTPAPPTGTSPAPPIKENNVSFEDNKVEFVITPPEEERGVATTGDKSEGASKEEEELEKKEREEGLIMETILEEGDKEVTSAEPGTGAEVQQVEEERKEPVCEGTGDESGGAAAGGEDSTAGVGQGSEECAPEADASNVRGDSCYCMITSYCCVGGD